MFRMILVFFLVIMLLETAMAEKSVPKELKDVARSIAKTKSTQKKKKVTKKKSKKSKKKSKKKVSKKKTLPFLPNAFRGNFVQQKKSVRGGKTITSSLILKYQYPSNFYLKELGADGSTYVCNRSQVWIYTPPFIPGEQGDLSIGSSSRHCYSKIFDSLRSGLNANTTYNVKKIDDTNYKLTFKGAARSRLDVNFITLKFKNTKLDFKNVSRLVIHYIGDNNPLTLTPNSLKSRKGFPAGTFTFKAPKNTKKNRI